MLYIVTFTINIPPMLVYIPAPWILWDKDRNEKPTKIWQNHEMFVEWMVILPW